MRLWIIDYRNFSEHKFRYNLVLNDDEIRHGNLYSGAEERSLYRWRTFALRSILGHQLRVAPEKIKFGHNDFGKPFVQDSSDFHFSTSHSSSWFAVATYQSEIGIDLEVPRTFEHPNLMASQILNTDEMKSFRELDHKDVSSYLLKVWCVKESYLKFLGKGMALNPKEVSICYEHNILTKTYFKVKTRGYDEATCTEVITKNRPTVYLCTKDHWQVPPIETTF